MCVGATLTQISQPVSHSSNAGMAHGSWPLVVEVVVLVLHSTDAHTLGACVEDFQDDSAFSTSLFFAGDCQAVFFHCDFLMQV